MPRVLIGLGMMMQADSDVPGRGSQERRGRGMFTSVEVTHQNLGVVAIMTGGRANRRFYDHYIDWPDRDTYHETNRPEAHPGDTVVIDHQRRVTIRPGRLHPDIEV